MEGTFSQAVASTGPFPKFKDDIHKEIKYFNGANYEFLFWSYAT